MIETAPPPPSTPKVRRQASTKFLANNPMYFYFSIYNRKSGHKQRIHLFFIFGVSCIAAIGLYLYDGDVTLLMLILTMSLHGLLFRLVFPQFSRLCAKKLLECSDDWWITGVNGVTFTPVLKNEIFYPRFRKTPIVASIVAMATGVAFLPEFSRNLLLNSGAPCLLWLGGTGGALTLFGQVVQLPGALGILTRFHNKEKLMVSVRGSWSPSGLTSFVRGWALLILKEIIQGGIIAVSYLPVVSFIFLHDFFIRNGQPTFFFTWASLAMFPLGLLMGSLYGLYARRRAPAIEAALAARFDELLELRRVLNHEVRGSRRVGGGRS